MGVGGEGCCTGEREKEREGERRGGKGDGICKSGGSVEGWEWRKVRRELLSPCGCVQL